MKNNIKVLRYIIIAFLFSSCLTEEVSCEAFDFKKFHYDSNYFFKNLDYSNGNDTLKVQMKWYKISKSSTVTRGGWGPGFCMPNFWFTSFDKQFKLRINYYFDYDQDDIKSNTLNIVINSSNFHLDYKDIKDFNKTIKIYNKDVSNQEIKKITLKNMRVTMIEKYSGEKLYLIKVGGSIVRHIIE